MKGSFLETIMDVVDTLFEILDIIDESEECFDHMAINMAQFIVELSKELEDAFLISDYYFLIMKAMAIWPMYELHAYFVQADPLAVDNIFLYSNAWKDTIANSKDLNSDDQWIIDRWPKITKFRTELESSMVLMK